MVLVNNPIFISAIFYFVIILVIFLSNLGNNFAKEKQILFYYIISVIIPILVYLSIIMIFY
jgi:hypothetical protein